VGWVIVAVKFTLFAGFVEFSISTCEDAFGAAFEFVFGCDVADG